MKRIRPFKILAGVLFTVAWFAFCYPEITAPWIRGFDSILRLVNVDRWIVVNDSGPWLPGLQVLLNLMSKISDSPAAYKLLVNLIALPGALLLLNLVWNYVSPWSALFTGLYFLSDWSWWFMSTSIYMEPLLLFNLSAALTAQLNRKQILACFFFLLATFSRPELLLAAPGLVISVFFWTKSLKSACRLAALYVPVLVFFLVSKWGISEFYTPLVFNGELSQNVLYKFFIPFLLPGKYFFRAVAVLAMIEIATIFSAKSKCQAGNRWLRFFILTWGVFILTMTVIAPFFHSIGPGSSRFSLFTVLPIFFLASLFIDSSIRRFPVLKACLIAASVAGITIQWVRFTPQAPSEYTLADEVLHFLGKNQSTALNEGGGKTISVIVTPSDRIISSNLLLYARFRGWRLEFQPPRKAPILKLFHLNKSDSFLSPRSV